MTCANCANNFVILPNISQTEKQRVCNECAGQLEETWFDFLKTEAPVKSNAPTSRKKSWAILAFRKDDDVVELP